MLPKSLKDLLIHHLIDVSKLTHYENEGDYWKVFNSETMTGFELTLQGDNVYTLDSWCTTSFYIDLSIKSAVEIKA